MDSRNNLARIFVLLGSVVLLASAGLHSVASRTIAFPALAASNLNPGLQAAFKVVFLGVAWHWIVIAVIALIAGFSQTGLRRFLVVFCGLSVLVEAVAGAAMMGLFIGNEMIGGAAILIVIGGLLFDGAAA